MGKIIAFSMITMGFLAWVWVIYDTCKIYKPIIKSEYDRRMKIWKKRIGI